MKKSMVIVDRCEPKRVEAFDKDHNVQDYISEPRTRQIEDMGVGVSISCMIIEAHSGHLTAENIPTGCVCFQFTLPIQ